MPAALSHRRAIVAAAVAYGAFIYALLPPIVIAINDDFGYLRSIVETIARGRPWTDEWLEPWAASLSVLSASVFKLTGSFMMATSGVQVVGAAITAAGVVVLLRRRGVVGGWALALSLLLLTTPTVLWKTVEFTGVVLYLPCFILAIAAVERRRWLPFFLLWCVAVSTRQTAVAWMALPLAMVIIDRRGARWRQPAAVIGLAVCVFALLSAAMNKTQMQAVIGDQVWATLRPARTTLHFFFGAAIVAGAIGLGALITGRRTAWSWRRCAAATAVAAIVAAAWVSVGNIKFEHHASPGSWAEIYVAALAALSIAGWSSRGISVRLPLLAAAAASLSLVAVRVDVWDYYYVDAALLALLSVLPADAVGERPSRGRAWPVVVSGALVVHAALALAVKDTVDRSYAAIMLAEPALRDGRLSVADLSFAPFGYVGWHVHPRLARSGAALTRGDLEFGRYLAVGSVALVDGPDPRGLAQGTFRCRWVRSCTFALVRAAESMAAPPLARFPLSDAEWRDDIGSTK